MAANQNSKNPFPIVLLGLIVSSGAFVIFCEASPESAAAALELFTVAPSDLYFIFLFSFLFMGIWALFNYFLFGPYLRLHQAREACTVGASEGAQEAQREADRLLEEYEATLQAARVEGIQRKISRSKEASAEASGVVAAAEDTAAAQISAAREQAQDSLEDLRQQAFQDSEQMVDELVGKLKTPASPASRATAKTT